ncbi:hypothetical protein SAMN05880582_1011612 [Rhizobium sp. RU20A]|uniref:amidohydrolase n=1 Tax=Rhizobium sp. RU20A TaxID=1907412 RepID=UPI0009566258|nr:amidohydrolase [Rhizobium sp. RU20A]SIQ36459.1 hypothetical protein SAMN05880582_1011612 [Rhizobium sp. RU20A]
MSTQADTIILNGKLLTMDPDRPRAEAIALSGGRILAVGTTAEIEALAGPETRRIDAAGGSVLPGFSENHMHLFSGAAELDHLQLSGLRGFEALKKAVLEYAAERPGDSMIFGQGTDYPILGEKERLTRHHLDAILPDRPIALFAPDHHTGWANTKALELAGILQGRDVGPGNEIVMGEDGLATGELREMQAFDPVQIAGGFSRYRLGLATGGEPEPYPSEAEFAIDMDVMRRGLTYCAAHGITTIQCMDGNLYQLELLAAVEKADGGLPCRVMVPFHFKNFMDTAMLDKAVTMRERYNSDWLKSGTVKFFYDGVLDSWTAVMVEPFADNPDATVEPLFRPERFKELAIEADRRGLQIAVHAIGDGAVKAVLDGYEAARDANGARDSRHRVEHIEVVHPDDIERFAALGVIASMQPPHVPGFTGVPLKPTVDMIGEKRWPFSYAWRTLKTAGARICFASDWPVSPIDPMLGIETAVTRTPWAADNPDQSFSLQEAIEAYTAEGAYAGFTEDRNGRLKPGFFADIVILDQDVEAIDPARLGSVKPAMTICGGRTTFSKQ